MSELTFCGGTYRRDPDGIWRYAWGPPVPGAVDLTIADVLAIGGEGTMSDLPLRPPTDDEFAWAAGRTENAQVLVRRPTGRRPDARDLVIGMHAPELHVAAMLTVPQIADLAHVSKATIDSYRYRGYLPEPQAVRGRTPLWARPVIAHWMATRPGGGWRTDLYGSPEEAARARHTAAHRARHQRPLAQAPR